MSADKETTLAAVLAVVPSAVLSDNARQSLVGLYGSLTAYEFGQMPMLELVQRMQLALPDPHYTNDARYNAARALKQLLLELGFTVKLAELTLPELLVLVVDQPEQLNDVRAALNARENIHQAATRTDGQWIVLNTQGGIDVGGTLKYVRRLNGVLYWLWRMFQGKRTVVLEELPGLSGEHSGDVAYGGKVDYERLVREAAKNSGPIEETGSRNTRTGGICTTIKIRGDRNRVIDIVVMEGGSIGGSRNIVRALLAPGVTVEVEGDRNDFTPIPKSWEGLAKYLKLA